MLLLVLGSAWLAGVFLSPQLNLPWEAGLFSGLGSVVVACFYWNRPSWRLPALAVLALTLGLLRYEMALPAVDPGTVQYYADQGVVTVRGLVVNEPEELEKASLRVATSDIKVGDGWAEIKGDILAQIRAYSDRRYGDLVQLTGELKSPSSSSGDTYGAYLARQGIYATMAYPKVQGLATDQAGPFYEGVHWLRDKVQKTLEATVPDPEASLLVGLLVGKRSSIPAELSRDFANTGTSHILAISGWNISLVAGVLLLVGRRFLGYRAVFLAVFGILLYTLFVGASPPVVRAAIMGLLYVSATVFGRRADVLTSLVMAGVLMTLWDPFVLWDVGFQLSFPLL
ncbi:MAG: competence protein ComEC family protein, partial [Chloroflexi bacterium]|nr:competence protein ComEC family protein [Chloroflexota bacterium]